MKKDLLSINIYKTREEMGKSAAKDIKKCILDLAKNKEEINIIFAAAPSQNEVLEALANDADIPWKKINAFHMDEYIGLSPDAPQGFGNFLKTHIFGIVPFKSVNYIDIAAADANAECYRYAELLKQHHIDVVIMGIGENGHIAFNDPPVADFEDKNVVKTVILDEICRNQQVNDGCFAHIDLVPKMAITLTIPTLFSGDNLFCIVPAKTKANAVYKTVHGNIDKSCPASILRLHKKATLYLDNDSSSLL